MNKPDTMTMQAKMFFLSTLLTFGAVSAAAQTLSVRPVSGTEGKQTNVVVSLADGESMTALQFRLAMPTGVTHVGDDATNCNATLATTNSKTHTLNVQALGNGDLLVIVYSMDLKPLKSGELVRIPVVLPSPLPEDGGALAAVRYSDEEAVSYPGSEALVTAISDLTTEPANAEPNAPQQRDAFAIYDLSGRRMPDGQKPHKGIYVQGGRKRAVR